QFLHCRPFIQRHPPTSTHATYSTLFRSARQLRNPRFPRDGRVTARARMYAQAGRYTYHRVDRQVQLGIGMTHERNILSAGEACRSEEHTSELQSRENLECRLLLEQKKYE